MVLWRATGVSVRGLPVGAAAGLWALAAGSAVFWWLRIPLADFALISPVSVTSVQSSAQGSAHALRALGHTAAPATDAQTRFQLLGVIAADAGRGSALLAVDGQSPQAFVQGQTVAEGWRLQSVGQTGVRLSPGPDGAVLELPLPTVDSRSSRQ